MLLNFQYDCLAEMDRQISELTVSVAFLRFTFIDFFDMIAVLV